MEQKFDPQSTKSKTAAQNTENKNVEETTSTEIMKDNNLQAEDPQVGPEAQQIEEGVVDPKNSAVSKPIMEQVERRAITDITPLEDLFTEKAKDIEWEHKGIREMSWEFFIAQYEAGIDTPEFKVITQRTEIAGFELQQKLSMNGFTPGVNDQFKQNVPEVGTLKRDDNAPKEKDYTPVYTEEEAERLIKSTAICEDEIARVKEDPRYAGVPFGDNVIINLTEAKRNGIEIGTPIVNRTHGKDQGKTGDSLMSFGPQHILIVATKSMTDDAGLESGRFTNDKTIGALPDSSLIVIDGNGRMNHLHSIPLDKWPNVYAVCPSKDAAGYYNLARAFDVINTEVSVWKTQDMVQKKLIYGAGKAHEGWKMINALVNKGYKYQAACEITTLATDRIKKDTINNGSDEQTFTHYKSAKSIYTVLRQKFGEDGTTLKTKSFPMKVSELWGRLQKNSGDDTATEQFIKFIKGISNVKVKEIKEAKSKKGGATKDVLRQSILEQEFFTFVGMEGIKLN